ncbi:baseplate J/gp47 family protein [Bradyrhizobium sp.]|uniref:baseplate J/gp47 family protein n=1 Tax=Bradyrhizobium sp. TaxID=376 RepID=UPI002E02CDA8|nr:baseplate J/gp47 family protein [Bradyrhizobium sp.]
MSTSFLTWDDATLDATRWQGIEYLSFVHGDPSIVTVHLARPASGILVNHVVVEGGESLTDLQHTVAVTNGSDLITVSFPDRGDYSPYTIRLLSGGNDPLHPFFDRAGFSFYIDCPAGDCRPLTVRPEKPPRPRPAVDLATKDYRGFVQMLGDWVAASNPSVTDLSPASFERMLLELLAHHADHLSYYQDRVFNEAFVATARERHALRQHGMLLGYRLDEGEAARTVLSFAVAQSGVLPAGVAVELAGAPGEMALVYVTEAQMRLDPAHNAEAMKPAAWPGASSAEIPVGATELLLLGHGLGLAPGQRLAFSFARATELVTLTAADEVSLAGWSALPIDPPTVAPADVTRIRWLEPLTSALAPWRGKLIISGNLVDAVHGAPRSAVVSPNPPSGSVIAIELNRRNAIVAPRLLADGSVTWYLRALALPDAPIVFERRSDGGSVPALTVTVAGEVWSREPHLWASHSYDHHYVAETDQTGQLWLQFGDDVHGRAIPVGRQHGDPYTYTPLIEIGLAYRLGATGAGNCAAETLSHVVPAEAGSPLRDALNGLGVGSVTNVVPGSGGRAPESEDKARFAIPDSLHHGPLQRAVTLADYAEAATMVPGVARAAARALDGVFNTVMILVDPKGQGDLDPALAVAVYDHIDRLRMAGREHIVRAPDYIPLRVELAICVEPGQLRHAVRDRVLAALRPGDADRRGWFHPDLLEFGKDLILGDLLAFVQAIPGVRSVKALAFRALDDPSAVQVVDRILVAPTEVARLDGDDNRPENGVLKVWVVGLDLADEGAFDLGGPAPEVAS